MSGPVNIADGIEKSERPDSALEGSAAEAWQAYNAMQATKSRHFDLLEELDLKKRNYNLDPTPVEAQRLAWLLTDHDQQVTRFTDASRALKQTDLAAHQALFDYIGRISTSSGRGTATH